MAQSDVLIVGAGPTGLVLALYLAKCGIRPRIIEKNSGPGQASRAMVVQARTLEFYRQLGFAEEVIRKGIKVERIHLREGDREAATFKLADMGEGISPYPFALSFPQDEHERLLVERLKAAGIEVEWGTELTEFQQADDCIRASLANDSVKETCQAAYLCGCDGAHSRVRQTLQFGFAGGTYDQIFYVADVQATGAPANRDLNFCLGTNVLCLVFPIRTTGMNRLIGLVPEEIQDKERAKFEDIRPYLAEQIGIEVEKVNWFSIYRVHHRVADQFRKGRVFLLGDAGHIHSPAGGQGMNTGIGDAVNLSWKLAEVLQAGGSPNILDTYETERIGFARSLVDTTDRAFKLMVGSNTTSQLFRSVLLPHLAPFAFGFSAFRRAAFRTVSQTKISYRESALSEGVAGEVHGGDRLPWVGDLDNFAPLASFDWQIHCYGEASEELRSFARSRALPLGIFAWNNEAKNAGLARDAIYLVRPDGYLSYASPKEDVARLAGFVDRFQIGVCR